MHAAAIGLELPCRRALPPAATVSICHNHTTLLQAARRAGRLLPQRCLRKALCALLQGCEQEVRRRLLAMPANLQAEADELVRRYRRWEAQVLLHHLTPHQLRLHRPDRFAAWALPACAYRHLAAQLAQPVPFTPADQRLALRCLLPITPCMRLGDGGPDTITAYLHAPSRYTTGPWWAVPSHRVQARYAGNCVEVVVE